MEFVATVRNGQGYAMRLEREAPSASALAAQLRGEGMVVLSVESRGEAAGAIAKHTFAPKKMSGFEVEMGLRQLSSMLSSSVTLLMSLRTVAEQSSGRRARRLWSETADRVLGGSSFAEAMEREKRTFGEVTARLAAVGEQSGELAATLGRAADQLESARNLRTAVVNALVYPLITLVMAFAVSVYLVAAVIPKLGEFLVDSGGELPEVTKMLMDFSEALREHALVIVLGGAAAAAAWWALRLFPATRELQDALLLKLPVAGRILRISGTAIFARSMEIMTSSGVTLLDGLESAAGILANRRLRSRAVEMRNSVLSGKSLADSVAPAKEFMPMLRHMAAVGEVSGSLPAAFAQTARFHELILALAIKRLGMLVEPVMIVVTGAIVGFVYIAFFMALFAIAGA